MRVIAGKFRSRKLKGPGQAALFAQRATVCAKRSSISSAPAVEDSLFVDLYAGTGAIGIEAVSRGAQQVILVESNAGRAS